MATYRQFRLGEVAPAQTGFGLIGPDCRSFNLLGSQRTCRSSRSSIPPKPKRGPLTTRSRELFRRQSPWSRPAMNGQLAAPRSVAPESSLGYALSSAGTFPPFSASFCMTCLCNHMFIDAESFVSPE